MFLRYIFYSSQPTVFASRSEAIQSFKLIDMFVSGLLRRKLLAMTVLGSFYHTREL